VIRGLARDADIAEITGKDLAERLEDAADLLALQNESVDEATLQLTLQRLTSIARQCGSDFERFADALALATDADFFDPRADRVALLTLHAAKGLEFPVVFITGLEDGLMPLNFGASDPASLAEERRLFYVGVTRAKDRLFLSRAERRLLRGRVREQAPSRFLADIERELMRQQKPELPRRRPEDRQLSLF
jgi:DNA helicase-2/ATP-dependent DNA helicase PcrA